MDLRDLRYFLAVAREENITKAAALCYDFGNLSDALEFVPLSPKLETGTVLAWKKDQTCSPAADQFLDFLKNAI